MTKKTPDLEDTFDGILTYSDASSLACFLLDAIMVQREAGNPNIAKQLEQIRDQIEVELRRSGIWSIKEG